MRSLIAVALLAFASAGWGQTLVTAPGETVQVAVPPGTNFPVTIKAVTVTYTIAEQTFTASASSVPYAIPSIPLALTINGAPVTGGGGTTPPPPPPPPGGNCGLTLGTAITFCDTFDKPFANGVREGQLDANVWGVSRILGDVNLGQSQFNAAPATSLVGCNGTSTVRPPNDVIVCNGQLREATNDNAQSSYEAGTVTSLAMYPKQPFDFAGRTGTVSFDVSNDTHGIHAVWPEFWLSDLPVPDPFSHFDSWLSLPQNGFGVRFAANATIGQYGLCPNGNNLTKPRWTVDSAIVVRNYAYEDVGYAGAAASGLKLNILDCVIAPADGSFVPNHVEVRVSQGTIDVYATDAGVAPTAKTLRHIASITNAGLTLTRGLVWLEDVHYNADKATTSPSQPSQRQHTFAWDNLAFDGPFTYRDFSFDAADANQSGAAFGAWNLAKFADLGKTTSWTIANVPANPQVSAVRVLFNYSEEFRAVPTKFNVTVNGHAHSAPWPFPANQGSLWRTVAVTVPVTDLVTGTNTVTIGSDSVSVVSNVNLVLVDVAGGVPVLPGSDNSYPLH